MCPRTRSRFAVGTVRGARGEVLLTPQCWHTGLVKRNIAQRDIA
jgi:hypothetical protein